MKLNKKQYLNIFTHKNKIYDVHYKEGKDELFTEIIDEYPFEFFVDERKEINLKYKYFLNDNLSLSRKVTKTPKQFKESQETYTDGGFNIFGNIKPQSQYRYFEYYDKEIFKQPRICHFDIETGFNNAKLTENGELIPGKGFPNANEANAPVIAISLWDSETDMYYMFGLKQWNSKENNVKYKKCKNEEELLVKFFKFLGVIKPAILLAYNGDRFDFPFLVNRLKVLDLPISLIDYNGITTTKKIDDMIFEVPKTYFWIDMLDAYKKFILVPRERYSLDYICGVELGENKVSYLNEFSDLQDLYINNYDTFMEYSKRDSELMKLLDDKISLTRLIITMSYLYNINFNEIFGTVAPWGQYLYCSTRKKDLILPKEFSNKDKKMEFEGGYVYCNPGYYEWIISEDVTSMYPLEGIVAHNLSPETYINPKDYPDELKTLKMKYFYGDANNSSLDRLIGLSKEDIEIIHNTLEKYNVTVSPAGDFYTKSYQGMVPQLIEKMFADRKKHKKEMKKWEQRKEEVSQEMKKRGIKWS